MTLLSNARRVFVLQADESGSDVDETTELSERLIQSLRWNGIQAELRRIAPASQSHIPGALLDTASNVGADLVVMGAYSHSRALELIFGGTTRHVLLDAKVPVLLCH